MRVGVHVESIVVDPGASLDAAAQAELARQVRLALESNSEMPIPPEPATTGAVAGRVTGPREQTPNRAVAASVARHVAAEAGSATGART